MLFCWEARILNKIYITDKYSKLSDLQLKTIEEIDYKYILQFFHKEQIPSQIDIEELINCANIISKSIGKEKGFLQNYLKTLNKIIKSNTPDYNVLHVVIFSCLSKCKIWPKILKSGQGLVPQLIQFYNDFHNKFKDELDYKYDSAILSKKHNKHMKRIQVKKKDHPKLMQAIKQRSIKGVKRILQQIKQSMYEVQQFESPQQRFLKQMHYYEHKQRKIPHLACEMSSIQIIQLLWEIGLDFEILDQERKTPLFFAVSRGNMQILQFLIDKVKVNINHTQKCNRTPVYQASYHGNLQVIQYLCKKGADLSIQSNLNRTPFSKACYLGHVDVVRFLISMGVQIVHKDSKGRTALHEAVWGIQGGRQGKKKGSQLIQDSPQIAQVLLEGGHPLQIQDNDGFTPILSAVSSSALKSFRLLMKYKPNLKQKTYKGQSIVYICARYGGLQILRTLVQQQGCECVDVDVNGYTPLNICIMRASPQIFMYLADRYRANNYSFNMKAWLKYKNVNYIIQWINANAQINIQYLHRQLLIDKYQFFLQSQTSFVQLNRLLVIIIKYIHKHKHIEQEIPVSFIKKYVQLSTHNYNMGLFPQYIAFMELLRDTFKYTHVHNLKVNKHMHSAQQVVRLLSFDSNLVHSVQSLKTTIGQLKYMVDVHALVNIIDTSKQQHNSEGIYGYDAQLIRQIVQECNNSEYNPQFHKLLTKNNNDNINHYIPSLKYTQQYKQDTQIILQPLKIQALQYKSIMNNLSIMEQCKFNNYQGYSRTNNVVIVDNAKLFTQMQEQLLSSHLVGIDVEHFEKKHSAFVCCIQIANYKAVYIIDPLSVQIPTHSISKFLSQLLSSHKIIKIFHAYDNDLRWLNEDFIINEQPLRNIVDTSRINSNLHNQKNSISLKGLAKRELNYEMSKAYQKSNWKIRPLFRQMVEYAAIDAQILLYIFLNQIKNIHKIDDLLQNYSSQKIIKCKNGVNIVKIIQQNAQW